MKNHTYRKMSDLPQDICSPPHKNTLGSKALSVFYYMREYLLSESDAALCRFCFEVGVTKRNPVFLLEVLFA